MMTTETPKIRKITTRFPNLECGFFAALLTIRRVREHLNMASPTSLEWRFKSTAVLRQESIPTDPAELDKIFRQKGWVFFNVAGGDWDQHGKKGNSSLCQICSLDLVREDYDFTVHRPWLKKIFNLVRANDLDGTRISPHRYNLRELMTALTVMHPDEPELVLEFIKLGFCGAFERCQAEVTLDYIFDPEEMKIGVEDCAQSQSKWFNNLVDEAINFIDEDWEAAKQDVMDAEKKRKVYTLIHPDLPETIRRLRVIEVRSDSTKAAQAARRCGYQVAIVWRPDGHCQIFTGNIFEYGEDGGGNGKKPIIAQWRIDLGAVAGRLRMLEANFATPRQRLRGNYSQWTGSGFVYYTNNKACPWYLPEFLSGLFNGTLSSPDVPPTKVRHDKVFTETINLLPSCRLLRQENGGEWQYAANPNGQVRTKNQSRDSRQNNGRKGENQSPSNSKDNGNRRGKDQLTASMQEVTATHEGNGS